MEMGAFAGALVALLAKAWRARSQVRWAKMSAAQLEANPSDPTMQERLAEQLIAKLRDPALREELQALLDEPDRQVAAATAAEERVPEMEEEQTIGLTWRP